MVLLDLVKVKGELGKASQRSGVETQWGQGEKKLVEIHKWYYYAGTF